MGEHLVSGTYIKTPKAMYQIKNIPVTAVFRMFKISGTTVAELGGPILQEAYKVLGDDFVPSYAMNVDQIKRDILIKPETTHDMGIQKHYLRETRKNWEARYTNDQLYVLSEFHYFSQEIDNTGLDKSGGCLGDEWYEIYYKIRGDLPEDFPPGLACCEVLDNVCDWKIHKFVEQTKKDYLRNCGEEKIEMLRRLKTPDDLPIDWRYGLYPGAYQKKIEDERVSG